MNACLPRPALYPARLAGAALKPVAPALIGQNSLPMFCLGVFLSFAAHWFLVQVEGDIVAQILVSVAGMTTMVGVAWLLNRLKALPDHFARPKAATPVSA